MSHEIFATKVAAIKAIKALGYTTHYLTGQSDDYAYGSREYFCAPDCKLNQWGMPINAHGTVSKVAGKWWISDFGKKQIA